MKLEIFRRFIQEPIQKGLPIQIVQYHDDAGKI